jgi:hypothetical protein
MDADDPLQNLPQTRPPRGHAYLVPEQFVLSQSFFEAAPSPVSLHKPDFVLSQTFFLGDCPMEVLGRYQYEAKKYAAFEIQVAGDSSAMRVSAPAHCGFQECAGAVSCLFIESAGFLVKQLQDLHRVAAIEFPDISTEVHPTDTPGKFGVYRGSSWDVLTRYKQEVKKRDPHFEFYHKLLDEKYGYTMRCFAPAHCGFEECEVTFECTQTTLKPLMCIAFVLLVHKLKEMHRVASEPRAE